MPGAGIPGSPRDVAAAGVSSLLCRAPRTEERPLPHRTHDPMQERPAQDRVSHSRAAQVRRRWGGRSVEQDAHLTLVRRPAAISGPQRQTGRQLGLRVIVLDFFCLHRPSRAPGSAPSVVLWRTGPPHLRRAGPRRPLIRGSESTHPLPQGSQHEVTGSSGRSSASLHLPWPVARPRSPAFGSLPGTFSPALPGGHIS